MAQIFYDSFETGDASAWGFVKNTVNINNASALVGSYGIEVDVSGTNDVEKYSLGNLTRCRARVYVDPNSLSALSLFGGTRFLLLRDSSFNYIAYVYIRQDSSNLAIQAGYLDDSGSGHDGGFYALTDAPHFVEIDWKASSAAGANDGYLTLWLDGVQIESLTGLDNDTKVTDNVSIGAMDGFGLSGTGTIFVDDLVIDDTDYIGKNPYNVLTNDTVTMSENVSAAVVDIEIKPALIVLVDGRPAILLVKSGIPQYQYI